MKKKYSVLIIEDHPFILEVFVSAFDCISSVDEEQVFKIRFADDCESGYHIINTTPKKVGIDIVFLDISLPPFEDGSILSGEDLGIAIRDRFPKAKIIICTYYNDVCRVKSLLKSINPEGFLYKGDIMYNELLAAIQTVLGNGLYYSKSVLKMFKNQIFNEDLLDAFDKIILYELSLGARMNEMPEILSLSMRAIERRKNRMKEIFGIPDQPDKVLIAVAKEKGFI